MEYSKLVEIYEKLASTTKRLEKTEYLAEFLKDIPKKELTIIIYLLQGRVFPYHDERKLGFSSQLMIKAISIISGESKDNIISTWKKLGDLGNTAEQLILRKKQQALHSEQLTVNKVIENLQQLSKLEGPGTVQRKVNLVCELLGNATPKEALYITRTVLEELRVGIAEGIIRDSIAKAYNVEVQVIQEAYDKLVDFAEVAKLAISDTEKLKKVSLVVGKPFKVMLALREENFEAIFKALGTPVQLEYKFDGVRLTIHKINNNITFFTRRLENVTKQFPELISLIKKHVKGKDFVLDAELVGYDPKTRMYLPFQNISQRVKRKYDIDLMAKKFPVELNIFDIVYYNNKPLFLEPLSKRRKLLEKIISPKKFGVVLTKKFIASNVKDAEEFYQEALAKGMEGIMAKKIDSGYKPGRYVSGWIKLKPTLESLDLVITKAYWGDGSRSKWLSSYTLSCKKDDQLLEIGKVSTGVKEKGEALTYGGITKSLKPLIINQKGKEVIIKPSLIMEVAYEEIQKSPTYSSGFALRFPRVIRLRHDKGLNDIDDLLRIKKIYKNQRNRT